MKYIKWKKRKFEWDERTLHSVTDDNKTEKEVQNVQSRNGEWMEKTTKYQIQTNTADQRTKNRFQVFNFNSIIVHIAKT